MKTKDYEVLKPIAHGGRVEKGSTVSLTEEEAENIGKDYVVEVGKKVSTEEVVEEKDIKDMNRKELVAKAKELGLKASGTKPELLERIKLHEESSDEDSDEKSDYKVLEGLEFPRGTVHEVDAIIELTEEEVEEFAEGLIEKVEDEE